MQWLRNLGVRFHRRRHSALLTAIAVLFTVRPLLGDVGAVPIVFSLAVLLVLLVALYTIQVDDLVGDRDLLLQQRRKRRIVGWALAVPALALRLATMINLNPNLYVVGVGCWLIFLAFVIWNQLRGLLQQREVTGETMSASVSIYLLLGLAWALLYGIIYHLNPGAFSFGSDADDAEFQALPPEGQFPIFVYFSLVTLATIGYGHVYPLSLQARYLAVAEGVTGQFYMAILVARLVAMHMGGAASRGGGSR
jgi:hypothetical protein